MVMQKHWEVLIWAETSVQTGVYDKYLSLSKDEECMCCEQTCEKKVLDNNFECITKHGNFDPVVETFISLTPGLCGVGSLKNLRDIWTLSLPKPNRPT